VVNFANSFLISQPSGRWAFFSGSSSRDLQSR
jgi:hypothetical protein